MEWWEKNRNSPFDLKKEIREYGQADVDVLLHGLIKYRQLVREINNDPFADYFPKCSTLAGLVFNNIRTNYLEKNKIAIVPNCGYNQERQSEIALTFLKWLSKERNILYKNNGGEQTLVLSFFSLKIHF